ncbi:CU044_5270 family protein [Thermoactinospora rubra]|uniref:CU044_5270 family protein n=1 Tax=Thermoactinospora rubra TaxID=1088767 RepID=UPI000A0FAC59|nr:CU044_5270 family protein [Thermoactinospora rubra]
MDELTAVRRLREHIPAMTPEAEEAARTRLLAAVRDKPGLAAAWDKPRPARPRLRWRLAVAAALAVLVGTGIVVTRGRPDIAPVAGVRELGERAARAAERGPSPIAHPDQWYYVKELQASPARGGYGYARDLHRREIFEQWISVDGKRVAWEQGSGGLLIQGTHPGIGAAELAREPVTPETVLDRIRQALADVPEQAEFSEDQRLFQAIYQLMGEQMLPPEVRSALFRALPTIPGVTVTHDVPDADGRRGIAFSRADGWARYDLILDPSDYSFLGTYGVAVSDRTFHPVNVGPVHVKAGTPLTWSARLDIQIVDKAGERP